MNKKRIRIIASVLSLLMALTCLCACGDEKNAIATNLSFKEALGYDYLRSLNGSTVSINGYMATSSPADGSFIFLMNLPYQSCPFCLPNTSELSNTMEIYPAKGSKFNYTTQAIRVTGILKVADEGETFSDPYGYEFSFKVVDASYVILKAEELSEQMMLWQKIAETDIVSSLNKMYDYVNFLCAWNTYFVNSYEDDKGVAHPGYYLYPSDALRYITTDGAQWNYGYKDGYFDSLIARIQKIDATAFGDIIENIRQAKALAERALSELNSGNYTKERKYVEKFGIEDDVYTLNAQDELAAEMEKLYSGFSNWIASWEM